jgi:hypothetical protein
MNITSAQILRQTKHFMMMRQNRKDMTGLMSPAQNGGQRRRYRARVVRAVGTIKGMLKNGLL